MTIEQKFLIGIVPILAIGGYYLLQEHDARLKAELTQTAQQSIIATNQKTIEQAKTDQQQIASNLQSQLAVIAGQRMIVVSPQQAAVDVSKLLPSLPVPVTVQTAPATATAPAQTSLVIPQADIPAFQKYKLNCDESNAKLTACSLDKAASKMIQDSTDSNLKAMTVERDTWKATAKGGTFWHKVKHDAIVIGVTAGVAYVAGKKF